MQDYFASASNQRQRIYLKLGNTPKKGLISDMLKTKLGPTGKQCETHQNINLNLVLVRWKQHSHDHSSQIGPSYCLSEGRTVKNCTSENFEALGWTWTGGWQGKGRVDAKARIKFSTPSASCSNMQSTLLQLGK